MGSDETNDGLEAFRAAEHAGWQRLAGGYDRYFDGLATQTIVPLLDVAQVLPGSRVLDLCCGPGYVAAAASRRGASPTGVDFAAEMVALARRRYPGLAFREGDAEMLDLPDGGFDAVVMNFGLHHLAHPERAAAEATRMLRPDGLFAFTVWAQPGENVGHQIILDAIRTHGRADVTLPEGPPLFRFSDPQECQRVTAGAGLVDLRVQTLRIEWDLPAPFGVFDAFFAGGVRPAMMMAAQPPAALEAIREAVRIATGPYEHGGRLRIPMAAVLAVARRRG